MLLHICCRCGAISHLVSLHIHTDGPTLPLQVWCLPSPGVSPPPHMCPNTTTTGVVFSVTSCPSTSSQVALYFYSKAVRLTVRPQPFPPTVIPQTPGPRHLSSSYHQLPSNSPLIASLQLPQLAAHSGIISVGRLSHHSLSCTSPWSLLTLNSPR